MKNLPIKISIVAIAIFVVLFSAILITGAEKVIRNYNIDMGGKQILSRIVDVPYIITDVPGKSENEYTFASRKYKMFCQFSKEYKGYNKYLKSHGCATTTLTCVLGAYVSECVGWTPYETITIAEKNVAGDELFQYNYNKEFEKQMPITLFGITKVLDSYGVDYEYEPYFDSDEELKKDIIQHLNDGKPVVFVISQINRQTNERTRKWTGSYHTMIMIGTDGEGNILIGNPAGTQRLQMVPLEEMTKYMFSCTEEPNSFYWTHKPRCGGYIKIME